MDRNKCGAIMEDLCGLLAILFSSVTRDPCLPINREDTLQA